MPNAKCHMLNVIQLSPPRGMSHFDVLVNKYKLQVIDPSLKEHKPKVRF